MSDEPSPSQRDTMRRFYQAFGDDEEAVCAAYADAERAGHVLRGSNDNEMSPEQYARALWADGIGKGWLPAPIPVREIRLMWVPLGLQPLTSYSEGESQHRSLHAAISAALTQQAAMRKNGKAPWIRAGMGQGAYVFNVQGFMLLKAAFDEGASRWPPSPSALAT